tara:strand:+ start:1636 stop:2256 length:621 start_codon:yes stop_codon:yes gene_type:complete
MKIVQHTLNHAKRFALPLLVGLLSFSLSTSILANPVLDNVAAGQVTIQQSPNSTVVNQSTTFDLPTTNVFDKGTVRYANGSLLANFNLIQTSTGNSLGNIIIPTKDKISVTFCDETFLYGEIGDPFFFNAWNISNPPPPPSASVVNTTIAGIVNQPQTNADDNDNYSPTYTGYTPYDPTVINKTYVDPLLETTKIQTGAACYQVIN